MGIVCSSGGATPAAAIDLLRRCGYTVEAALVTDRPCGAESVAQRLGIPHRRIPFVSGEQFSKDAANWLFGENKLDWSCLFFLRLISKSLYGVAPCFNIHPSLLPAFPGFGALKKAASSGVRFFGATAHLVDQSVDGGLIVGQATARMPIPVDLGKMNSISFAQKVYLLLVIAERTSMGLVPSEWGQCMGGDARFCASPSLIDSSLEDAFFLFLEDEGISWRP
jgi:phosphoribosylglycinamide formyltransferase-1